MNLVSEIMNSNAPYATPITRIEEIERLMNDKKINELSLVDSSLEKKFIGMISKDQIKLKTLEYNTQSSKLNVEQCMVLNPPTIYVESSIEDCANLMTKSHLSTIPVIDAGGRFCGIVEKKSIDKL